MFTHNIQTIPHALINQVSINSKQIEDQLNWVKKTSHQEIKIHCFHYKINELKMEKNIQQKLTQP